MFVAYGMDFVFLGQVLSRIGRQSELELAQRQKLCSIYLCTSEVELLWHHFLSAWFFAYIKFSG